jgi:hypothetical protein
MTFPPKVANEMEAVLKTNKEGGKVIEYEFKEYKG